MGDPSSSAPLPSSTDPSLHLSHPTPAEKEHFWTLNSRIWRGALSMTAYLARERYLAEQALTRDGGITYWVLVESGGDASASQAAPRRILAGCETLRKRGIVARRKGDSTEEGRVEDTVAHGVGSVYCPDEYRGRGYAGRMMEELGKVLRTWQGGEMGVGFSVLFSDIGQKFYAQRGWKVFRSSHITLPPENDNNADASRLLPNSKPLYAGDLSPLCEFDETQLRAALTKFPPLGPNVQVAVIPDVETVQWHHAREEFVAKEITGRKPDIKGAIVTMENGKRVWAIWTRVFGKEKDGHTFYILRLVIERGDASSEGDEKHVTAVAAVLHAAQVEAANWGMRSVEVWNPSDTIVVAAKKLLPSSTVVDREAESITSLMWHGNEPVDWIANDKYGWC